MQTDGGGNGERARHDRSVRSAAAEIIATMPRTGDRSIEAVSEGVRLWATKCASPGSGMVLAL